MVRIIHQRGKCNGCNACAELDPNRWRVSRKDGKCTLIGGKENNGFFTLLTSNDEYELGKRAEQHCHLRLITVKKV